MQANGSAKVPLIQQNGAPMNPPSGPQLRPQFRRQGSSFGGAGHVAPMAVMAMPNKIDYSVTKGGLRLWAVLLVFVFLCSSLYTIFSAKDLAELALDIDGDGIQDLDVDGDIDEDADEVANQNRRSDRDTTPSKEYSVKSRSGDEFKRAHAAEHRIPETADDELAEEEEENGESEEETLFAGLRAKVEERAKKKESPKEALAKPDESNVKEPPHEEKEERVSPSRRKDRRAKKAEVEEEEERQEEQAEERPTHPKRRRHLRDEEVESVDEQKTDVKEIKEVKEQREGRERKQQIEKKGRVRVRPAEYVDEEDDEEDNDENQEKEEHKEDAPSETEQAKEKEEDESPKETKEGEMEEQVKEEEEVEEEKPALGEVLERSAGARKRRRVQPSVPAEPKRACKRKHCPPDYDSVPRMELLKQKRVLTMSRRNKRYEVKEEADEDLEDFDELEDDEDEDEEVEDEGIDIGEDEDQEIREIAAIKKERLTGRSAYKRHAITNREDHRFRMQLDKADYLVEKHEYAQAFAIFDEVLRHNEDSARAHFGRARAYDIMSEMENSNALLDKAILEYQEVLDIDDTPDALFRQAAYRLIDRARFRGALHKALVAQRSLIDRYPDEVQLQNDFGLFFLMMGRCDDALKIFKDVLQEYPENGVAQAYYGYILKLQGDLENGVLYMRKGLRAARQTIADPRFYYHFGDALTRLGRNQDALRVYTIGAKIGLFLSAYQRSVYNFDGITSRPWWTVEQTTYAKHLKNIERQWTVIREEALAVLDTNPRAFVAERPEMTIGGTWSAFYLFRNGFWNKTNCARMPKSCDILRDFKDSSNCSKSQMKISLLTSGSRVWPHCGYSNSRLQAHLGLVVPSEGRLRVADETRGWKTGRFVVFDDSFEHELSFTGASANKFRLVLVLDLWHPEIEPSRRVFIGNSNA